MYSQLTVYVEPINFRLGSVGSTLDVNTFRAVFSWTIMIFSLPVPRSCQSPGPGPWPRGPPGQWIPLSSDCYCNVVMLLLWAAHTWPCVTNPDPDHRDIFVTVSVMRDRDQRAMSRP